MNPTTRLSQDDDVNDAASDGFLDNWLKKRKQLQMSQSIDSEGGNSMGRVAKTTQTKIKTFSQMSQTDSRPSNAFDDDLIIQH